ncbi:hypothetical protein [Virgisporangium ochraceum]|nr:hypothetical protein [Virgisporangium ochraceum]
MTCTGLDVGSRDILVAHRRSGGRTDPALGALVSALVGAARAAGSVGA